jgi:glutaredoxin 3
MQPVDWQAALPRLISVTVPNCGRWLVAKVEVYSSIFCPYCARAKSLLERKGVDFETIDVMEQPNRRDEMVKRAGGRTSVPQIFINGEHIGGSDDLHALDRAGQLDAKLAD